jgi:hypothetical protein
MTKNQSITVLDVILNYAAGHYVPTTLAIERVVRHIGAQYIPLTTIVTPATPKTAHWFRILPPFGQTNITKDPSRGNRIGGQSSKIKSLVNPVNFLCNIKQAIIWVWILSRQMVRASRRSHRVVIHVDTWQQKRFLLFFLSFSFFKLSNIARSMICGSTEQIFWIQMHSQHTFSTVELFVIRALALIRVQTRFSVYSKALLDNLSSQIPGRVTKIPPLSMSNRMINEENFRQNKGQGFCENAEIICLVAGQVRPGKGYGLLQKLASTAEDDLKNTEVKIILRVPRSVGLCNRGNRIRILEMPDGHIAEQEYVRAYLTSDVIIMPYISHHYAFNNSGVFVDAVTLGCLPIVPKDTTMATELISFKLSELVFDWQAGFSWLVVASVVRDALVREKFNAMTLAYRQRHSLHSVAESIRDLIAVP